MIPSAAAERSQAGRLVFQVSLATVCRLLLNTARRFPYPFAPVLSRGLGVPLTAVTSLIALNQITGLAGLFLGPLMDRIGYRRVMVAGLALMAGGMLCAGLFPVYGMVMGALFMAGLGKSVFDPSVLAYASQRVPFGRRGLVTGLMEFSWAGSTLLGVPLIGICIAQWGWRSPFFLLGGLGLLGVTGFLLLFTPDVRGARSQTSFGAAWGEVMKRPDLRAALGVAFCFSAASDALFVVYGAWLEQAFRLSTVSLGMGTGIIGLAELLGESLTASFGDRIGLKRSVALGLLASSAGFALLPIAGHSLPMALVSLFLVFLCTEFSIVSFISLCTELLPEMRATMMSAYLAAASVGRVVGTLIGVPVWMSGGIHAITGVCILLSLSAFLALRLGLGRR